MYGCYIRHKQTKMKKKIAIVAGGDSSEYEVSLRSATGIYSFMDKALYDLTVVCLHGQDWKAAADYCGEGVVTFHSDPTNQLTWCDIDRNDFSYTYNGEKHVFDFAYITIHGTPGENGLLQGYFDLIGLPYSCCGVLAAAITFNKFACNHYLSNFGINISPSLLLRDGETISDQEVLDKIGLPCFIKSNVGGSSFGCTKVKTATDIQPAIKAAFAEGDEVIIEAFMKGTEITSGVYRTRNKQVAFPITEVVTHNEFFDYDAKYKGQVEEITPARVPDAVRDHVQELTLSIHKWLGCKGIIRTDYILIPTQEEDNAAKHIVSGYKIMLLEVNTTPGMTTTSFIPQQVRAAGLDIKDVLSDIIENR